jgi:hypothetical protein
MNALTNRIAMITASALVFGTMAFAQAPVLKAQIPFAFHAASGTLPAGAYTIRETRTAGNTALVSLHHDASNRTIFLMRQSLDVKAYAAPAVVFRCGEEGCALSAIRQADGATSYYGRQPSKHDKEMALVAVPVLSVKAD